MRFQMEGRVEPMTLSEILNLQFHSDRAVRKASAAGVTQGLETQLRTLAYIFNTLVQDKATQDRLRGHAYQEQTRHLENELTPETVEMVIQTAVEGYPLVARYYEAKRRVLGLEELAHYDRYAPVTTDELITAYDTARDLILEAFGTFDKRYQAAAAAFFKGGWIDAEARPAKRAGAFCSYITPDAHPYILMNYLGKPGDIRTLAHELGHGVHAYLSRTQKYLDYQGTLPMAEVASTFAEMLVFDHRQDRVSGTERLGLFAHQIEQAMSTIFRQAALYRFEQAIHRERRTAGELTAERFSELWQENVGAMFAGSVTLEAGHRLWWSYIHHFIATPFYVYAYTFGEMLAMALYHKYRTEGEAFPPRYVAMLTEGGSRSPEELASTLGIDLNDPAFWRGALTLLEEQVAEFERLADSAAGRNTVYAE